ncbi:MAG: sugar phosphate nucleotidyltransferase [Anaerolineae bacterium]|nr:sugar phosphate nucleotidyltransferase [Anaerolineae bacterium]
MGFYALIMAGGIGTRLWPLSRQTQPKQSLALFGESSMFSQAVERIRPLFQPEQIFVATSADQKDLLASQVPDLPLENFIIEPEGRGTAPCIGLSAINLLRRDPDATMAVLAADHRITDGARFCKILGAAKQIAEQEYLVTLGITPSHPSTGYGYIKQGTRLETVDGFAVFRADRFTEKPDSDTARQMMESGEFSWNSGMFIWRLDRILGELKRQMPDFYSQLTEIDSTLGKSAYDETLQRVWSQVAKQTIDYGVMENADDVVVIPVDIGWSDVGSWASLNSLLPHNEDGNHINCPHIGINTTDSLIWGNKRLIATIGLEGVIVIDTEDALLICSMDREQEVKEIVRRLKKEYR